jgi:group I intron endonuclease
MITIIKSFEYGKSKISHKYMNHGKFVPVQKYSKINNLLIRNYSTNIFNNSLINDIKYIKKYENAYNMKKNILIENKGKSGIYMLKNILTNDIYIGQSIDISKRFKNYFNLSYIKSKNNFLISKALIDYGYYNFSLIILEYCDKSDLTKREQYYFDKLNPKYNILKIAGSSLNFKHSEETKARISKALKRIYVREKSGLFNKTHSEKTKELIKQIALGRIHSEETKLKMSSVRGNFVNIYEKCTLEGFKLIGSFVSARRAAKFLNMSGSTVIRYMRSGEIFKERYKFSSK